MPTVRQSIVDAINELNKVLPVIANDQAQFSMLMLQRSRLQRQLVLVLSDTLTGSDTDLSDALSALQEATDSAKEAQTDIANVNRMLGKMSKAIKAVGKVIKGISEVV
ncbi:hypothetical protein [Vibrio panuliri]|uniref:Uncharacterized protein n=1 Tax=Vibrio panuliri TaxID=1381081 RepID=A0ABX3F628_9VIBR|nr:hypothetical protein [Vibrio panuliri]KAB1454800.1 hypothetical protein F7O85_18275 [Vibrio panuliri]OLQ85542.1 hypothetical protein BIY20_15835 [Vibrio panuliri]